MKLRNISKRVTGSPAVDGAGVRLVRVFGNRDTGDFDPFLMLDAFDSTRPSDYTAGFPWHPHRGIETITMLVEGEIDHGDSLGNRGTIKDGGCQWMTAGSGIIHQEMPIAAPRMLGLQLWLNLAAKEKMCVPAYRDLTAENTPIRDTDGVKVAILAGDFAGTAGAMKSEHTPASLFSVSMRPGSQADFPLPSDYNAFIYVFEGSAFLHADDAVESLNPRQAILLGAGDAVRIVAPADNAGAVRFVLCAGRPLREPVAWGGPIVMNTREELERAFRELDEGTFIKDKIRA